MPVWLLIIEMFLNGWHSSLLSIEGGSLLHLAMFEKKEQLLFVDITFPEWQPPPPKKKQF